MPWHYSRLYDGNQNCPTRLMRIKNMKSSIFHCKLATMAIKRSVFDLHSLTALTFLTAACSNRYDDDDDEPIP